MGGLGAAARSAETATVAPIVAMLWALADEVVTRPPAASVSVMRVADPTVFLG